jgi:hypothetical protein
MNELFAGFKRDGPPINQNHADYYLLKIGLYYWSLAMVRHMVVLYCKVCTGRSVSITYLYSNPTFCTCILQVFTRHDND